MELAGLAISLGYSDLSVDGDSSLDDDGFFITGCSPCGGVNYDYLLMKTDENGDILGCTDPNSFNYDLWANKLDESCPYIDEKSGNLYGSYV